METDRRERKNQPRPAVADGAQGLDRMVHEPLRLAILGALTVDGPLPFSELKKRLGATDGNLGLHARRLEGAGYIACAKRFEGRVPRSEYRVTAAGRRAVERYLDRMEALIGTMRRK